ncbi:MAG: ComF family protein [Lachnospiraceae bacterium]|nr:ComF family protein [Lachnospiraceae bacterium]
MSLLDWLYPKRCPICLDALPPGKKLICGPCRERVRRVESPTCMKCGKPLSDETYEYCKNCESHMPPFVRGLSWAEYSSKYIRRMLTEVKYHENPQLLDYPCLDFAERIRKTVEEWQAEALVPVPVHRSKLIERGYNQAEEITKRLSKHLGLPSDSALLIRREKTRAQKELTEIERRNNLATAFFVPPQHTAYQTVILVDDIYTTGSTAEACTRTLLNAGISKVYFLSLAIGRDNRVSL